MYSFSAWPDVDVNLVFGVVLGMYLVCAVSQTVTEAVTFVKGWRNK